MLEPNKISTEEIEVALANHFNPRINLIVPNVSWGMFLGHECDLFILTKSGYGIEVEIKISKYDLIRDKKKTHQHNSSKIKKLYFAMPKSMEDLIYLVPARAGIFLIYWNKYNKLTCEKIKEAKINSKYRFTEEEKFNLARLGTMRIWGLKKRILNMNEHN